MGLFMGNETVSIIMPAYNAEETIKDSILSILGDAANLLI